MGEGFLYRVYHSLQNHLSAYLCHFNFQSVLVGVSLLIGLHLLLAWNSDAGLLVLFSNQNLSFTSVICIIRFPSTYVIEVKL